MRLTPRRTSDAKPARGAVLLLVLWAMVILSLLAGGLTFAIRQDVAVCNLERDRQTAHWLARAGVERAIAAVMEDLTDQDLGTDACSDDPAEMQEIAMTGGTFTVMRDGLEEVPHTYYGASDESAKLNINSATREQLMKLPDMTDSIAGAIIDWRDRDEQPQPDGIERGHYSSLEHPYVIRNGPFQTTRELLLVRGVTPELFYGEDRNLNGLLDANEDDGDASEPADNRDGRLDRGWAAWTTIYSYEKNQNGRGTKRVNVTSADAGTLTSRLGLEQWAADAIVQARGRNQFKSIADLLDVRREAGSGPASTEPDRNARGDNEKNHAVTRDILKRIADDLTLKDDERQPGRININTAPLEVLRTIPGVDDDMARSIFQMRESGGGFISIGDLLDFSSITKEKFAALETLVTVRSSVFCIRSHGYSDSGLGEAVIECVVDRGADGHVPRILYWCESEP